MSKQVAWALVADAGKARILERRGLAGPWVQIEAIVTDNPSSREGSTERPGRVHESVGAARHAIEPRADPHEAGKTAFAHHLAERLESVALQAGFDRLLLVAPPPFLGRLRAALGNATRTRLRADLDRDLVHAPIADIVARLAEARPV